MIEILEGPCTIPINASSILQYSKSQNATPTIKQSAVKKHQTGFYKWALLKIYKKNKGNSKNQTKMASSDTAQKNEVFH